MSWSLARFAFLAGAMALSASLSAQSPAPRVRSYAAHTIVSIKHDVSPDLRDIPPDLTEEPDGDRAAHAPFVVPKGRPTRTAQPDGALQDAPVGAMLASPSVNFDGVTNRNGVLPPDTNGDVSANYYVQWVNLSYAVYSKTGTTIVAPTNGNTIFTGFGGPCETTNDGDPIVLYDELADRWLLSQFALPNYPSGPFYQCIAVSTSSNPGGSYYRYQFQVSATKLNDYPKFGVWPDGYYMTVNQFSGNSYAGAGIVAFERAVMLTGGAARMAYVDTNDVNLGGMLPSDLDGAAPPSGTPNYIVQFDDGTPVDQLEVWKFVPNWGGAGAFTHVTDLAVAAFDSNMCNYARSCIPQAGTNAKLDAISDRLMYRLQYRNMGDHDAFVTNHTVDVDGTDRAGIRWYEVRRAHDTSGTFSLYQQGTFSPDATNRWMGSAAMDKDGNIGLAYNTSSSTQYPSIRYTGRLATDPLGQMAQEADILVGSGSQTQSSSRWGDYSNLSVDPSDGCTFWATLEYTNQGRPVTAPWRTRIAAFALSSTCGGGGGGGDTIPTAPTSLTASPSGKRGIALTWTDASTNESSFRVFRCTGSSCTPDPAGTPIATTAANTTTYKDGGLSSGTTYGYVVTACNTAGCSSPSPVARATAR